MSARWVPRSALARSDDEISVIERGPQILAESALQQAGTPTSEPLGGDDKVAVEYFLSTGRVSISALQRHLLIGYRRAASIVGSLEAKGIVSAPDAQGRRRLVISPHVEVTSSVRPGWQPPPPRGVSFSAESHDLQRPDGTGRVFLIATSLIRRAGTNLGTSFRGAGSVREPWIHLSLAAMAAVVFLSGQYLGGVALLAYGAILFMAGER
jgi:hypothetical protein